MNKLRKLWVAGGAVLIASALWQIAGGLREAEPPRIAVNAKAPLVMAGQSVSISERPAGAPGRVYLDVNIGEHRFRGSSVVLIEPGADRDDVGKRYAGRFRFAAPRDPDGEFVIIEMQRELSGVDRVAWRAWRIDATGKVSSESPRLSPEEARQRIALDLYGDAPRPQAVWPPLAGLLLGGFALAAARSKRRSASLAAAGLVCVVASMASFVGWPMMVSIGLKRTLPAVLLALGITLAVAILAGPRAESAIRKASRWRAGFVGAAFGFFLLAVFVTAQVSLNGFIAPVFRAPGGGLSPEQMLVHDFVRPAAALVSVGTAPALIFGAVFAWINRRQAGILS